MKTKVTLIEDIANFMIEVGISKTTTGNYFFGLDQFTERFNIDGKFLDDIAEDIEDELYKREEIEILELLYDNHSFDIYFGTTCCGLGDYIDDDGHMTIEFLL